MNIKIETLYSTSNADAWYCQAPDLLSCLHCLIELREWYSWHFKILITALTQSVASPIGIILVARIVSGGSVYRNSKSWQKRSRFGAESLASTPSRWHWAGGSGRASCWCFGAGMLVSHLLESCGTHGLVAQLNSFFQSIRGKQRRNVQVPASGLYDFSLLHGFTRLAPCSLWLHWKSHNTLYSAR